MIIKKYNVFKQNLLFFINFIQFNNIKYLKVLYHNENILKLDM